MRTIDRFHEASSAWLNVSPSSSPAIIWVYRHPLIINANLSLSPGIGYNGKRTTEEGRKGPLQLLILFVRKLTNIPRSVIIIIQ